MIAKHSYRMPAPLKRGDTVGIVAASGPPDPDILREGVKFFEEQGLEVREGCHVYQRQGYLAGTDSQRCEDLNSMLADEEVRGIFFARGGYGVMRVLDTLDMEAIERDPKLLVGMSDVTALQLSLSARCGLVTLAGPMTAGQIGWGLDELSRESLATSITEPLYGRDLSCGSWEKLRILRNGRAEGTLLGGCLSLVTALLGTRHCPDYEGAILLLEDVNEPAYRLDRMLTQLKLAGILDAVSGLVLGHFLGPEGVDLGEEVERVVSELTEDRAMPIISAFPHGHTLPNVAVTIGAPIEIDTDQALIRVLQKDE
jgi:muramoyltetrapeptide carboxypeptidase